MSFYFQYLLLELKRTLRFLPKLLAGALALCLVIGAIGIGCTKVLYNSESLGKVNIAIVVPENDKYIGLMMSIVEEIKSVKKLCKFTTVDESQAYEMVENGDAFGAVIFPERFVQDIVHGKNTPAKVIVGNENSIEGALFEELAFSGTEMLSSVQAGIYTFIDEYEEQTGETIKNSDDIIKNINLEYINITLPRENYFEHKTQSVTGRLTTVEYYAVMGAVLFILLFGMGLGKIFVNDNKGFKDKLRVRGVNDFVRYLTNVIMAFLIYAGIFAIALALAYKLGANIEISGTNILFLALGILLGACIVVGVYTVIEAIVPAALTIFVLGVGMCFISGGFLPTAFLPDGISNIAPYMPTTIMGDMLGKIFDTGYSASDAILYAIMLLTVNVLILMFYGVSRLGGAEK